MLQDTVTTMNKKPTTGGVQCSQQKKISSNGAKHLLNAKVDESYTQTTSYVHACAVCQLVDVIKKHFVWNFPHVPNLGQDLTLGFRSLTNASMSAIRPLRNGNQ